MTSRSALDIISKKSYIPTFIAVARYIAIANIKASSESQPIV